MSTPTITAVQDDLREVCDRATSETVLDVAVKWIARAVSREVTGTEARREWVDAFTDDYDHGGHKLADALYAAWAPVVTDRVDDGDPEGWCLTPSPDGRVVCTLSHGHGGDDHEALDLRHGAQRVTTWRRA